jgi:segregation and condensation protein A
MMEYRKFKEAARVLRDGEDRNFGALPRGRTERPPAAGTSLTPTATPEPDAGAESAGSDEEAEAGIYELLAAFREVMSQRPRIPVHEVEIDEVTIEDRMQHVETELIAAGRILFEDLFGNDPRRMAKVVTFMALLELCKLDRIVIRQNRTFGTIWVYRKEPQEAANPEHLQELAAAEAVIPDEPPEGILPGLVEWVQDQIRQRKARTALDQILTDLEKELREEGAATPETSALESLAAASAEPGAPGEESASAPGPEAADEDDPVA